MKIKRKGAYDYEKEWHKDHSFLVIQKAVEAHLVHGVPVEEFIRGHQDKFDFMGRVKLDKKSRIEWNGQNFKGVVRYIVTRNGSEMVKVMPAKGPVGTWKRSKNYDRRIEQSLCGPYKYLDIKGMPWDKRIHTGNRGVYNECRTRINAGQKVTVCNRIGDLEFDIDFEFYIREARKLIDVFTTN